MIDIVFSFSILYILFHYLLCSFAWSREYLNFKLLTLYIISRRIFFYRLAFEKVYKYVIRKAIQ